MTIVPHVVNSCCYSYLDAVMWYCINHLVYSIIFLFCYVQFIISNWVCYGQHLSTVVKKLLKQQSLLYTRKSIMIVISSWMLPCWTTFNFDYSIIFLFCHFPSIIFNIVCYGPLLSIVVNKLFQKKLLFYSRKSIPVPIPIPNWMLSCGTVLTNWTTLFYSFSSMDHPSSQIELVMVHFWE